MERYGKEEEKDRKGMKGTGEKGEKEGKLCPTQTEFWLCRWHLCSSARQFLICSAEM